LTTVLADYVIALADLAEAEGRAMRRGITIVAWSLVFILLAAALLLGAFLLWLWAVYLTADAVLPAAIAAALTGLAAFAAAGVLAWFVKRMVY
jgi:hypothetical protein